MKYIAAVFTTLAVGIASVCAAPAQEQPQPSSMPSDPFVACVRNTSPEYSNFPKGGKTPTQEQLRACFSGAQPQKTARELVSGNAEENFHSALQSRALFDIPIPEVKKTLSLARKGTCTDDKGEPTKLHDEFVWAKEVPATAGALCTEAINTIEKSKLREDGGLSYAFHQFNTGHDDQNNFLHNNRELLLTMAIDWIPPAKMAQGQLKAVFNGVHTLCSSSVMRLMSPVDGCTKKVKWYASKKVAWPKEQAARGGLIGMFLGGTGGDEVGTVRLEFSEDAN